MRGTPKINLIEFAVQSGQDFQNSVREAREALDMNERKLPKTKKKRGKKRGSI